VGVDGGAVSDVQLATLVHLTDLHLFVRPDGKDRGPGELSAILRVMKYRASQGPVAKLVRVIDKLELYNSDALLALEDSLEELRATEPGRSEAPLIVVHTGDADTVGPQPIDGSLVFGAYEYLHDFVRPKVVADPKNWVDTYGNHDVWPGTLPYGHPRQHRANFERIRQVEGLESYELPLRFSTPDPGIQLELHRLNTVHPDTGPATMANGKVSTHPITTRRWSVRRGLKVLQDNSASQGITVRVLLMHHPPFPFEAGWFERYLTTGKLTGARQLGKRLERDLRIHLVIAGHRHALNPKAKLDRRGTLVPQPPLPARTVQLVSESPTASPYLTDPNEPRASGLRAAKSNSFCVYRLYVDPAHSRLRVNRERLAFQGDSGDHTSRGTWAIRPFRLVESVDVVSDIPL
jgi:3',5'-cyclic AMP phosphodiesterase CpdA